MSYSGTSIRFEISLANETRRLVSPDIADTTTAEGFNFKQSSATCSIRSMVPMLVPPNLNTGPIVLICEELLLDNIDFVATINS